MTVRNNFVLARHEGRPVQYRCSETTGRNWLCKGKYEWPVWVYIVMDGCMLLRKSSTISENCKERKRHAVLFSRARTLTLTVEKLKSSQTKLATGACKNRIVFAVDNFLPCIPTGTNIFTVSGAGGCRSTAGSSIWPVLFVQLNFYWARDAFLYHSHNTLGEELCWVRGGRPGLCILTSLMVSVDVKQYWIMLTHWSQLVPNTSTDIRGH